MAWTATQAAHDSPGGNATCETEKQEDSHKLRRTGEQDYLAVQLQKALTASLILPPAPSVRFV